MSFKVLKYLIIFIITAFFEIYFFSLRLNKDEIIFINSLNESGTLHHLGYLYTHWTPRVFGVALLLLISKICTDTYYIWIYTGIIYSAIFIYTIITFRKTISDYYQTTLSKSDSSLIALLFFTSLFFLCKTPAEIFGWYPCILIYLLPCILLMILIFKKNPSYFTIILSALIISSGAEHIVVFSNAILVILLCTGSNYSGKKRNQLLLFLMVNTFLFLFFIFSSGIFNRMVYENSGRLSSLSGSFASMVNCLFSPYSIVGVLILFLLIILLPDVAFKPNSKQLTLICIAGYSITLIFHYKVFGNVHTGQRIWFLTNVINTFVCFYIMNFLLRKIPKIKSLRLFVLSLTLIVLGTFFSMQSVRLIDYCRKYDYAVYAYKTYRLKSNFESTPDPGITSNEFPDFNNELFVKFFYSDNVIQEHIDYNSPSPR